MEFSPLYTTTNLAIVILFYVGLAVSLAWTFSKETRSFGLALTIAWLILTQIHASTLYYLAFTSLPLGYNTISSILILTFALILSWVEYKKLKAKNPGIFSKQLKQNILKSIIALIVFTVALSTLNATI